MKKTYLVPETIRFVCCDGVTMLSSASTDTTRSIDGGVTDGEEGVPTVVGEYTGGEGEDPFGGKGQGTGGTGNRSKEAGLWDDWSW